MKLTNWIAVLGLSLASAGAGAVMNANAPPPAKRYAPLLYHHAGVVGNVDAEKGTIVINGTRYHFDGGRSVRHLRPDGKAEGVSSEALKPGARIGFNLSRRGRLLYVDDLWLLQEHGEAHRDR